MGRNRAWGAAALQLALVGVAMVGAGPGWAQAAEPKGSGWAAQVARALTDGQAWQERAHWRLAASPFTHHFRPSDEHHRVWALALERQREDGWLAGFSPFSNSFGQPSSYLYVGHRFDRLGGVAQLYGQVSAGLLYGYRGQFEDKVPLNHNGFSPGALVGLGWQFDRHRAVTAHMLGDAGVMLQLSWDIR